MSTPGFGCRHLSNVVMVLGMLIAGRAGAADSFRIVHAFDNTSKAAVPYSSLVESDGWLYGTTAFAAWGGSAPNMAEIMEEGGSVFRVRPDGSGFEVLKQFSKTNALEGYEPFQGLTPVGKALIGTLRNGGELNGGVLYTIGKDGSGFRVLHHFGGEGDGKFPYAAPILVGSVLYGTTGFGGPNSAGGDAADLGAGVLYSYDLTTDRYRIEKSFSSPGSVAFGGLTRVGDWLYGMVCDHRNRKAFGQVFRYRPSDGAYEVVHLFAGGSAGGYPYDSIAWDGGHFIYGTTLGYFPWHPLKDTEIAALSDEGVIFRIDLDRSASDPLHYEVIHDFALQDGDGAKPNSRMLVAPDGYLYGVAHGSEGLGGTVDGVWYGKEHGTLYRLRPDGSEFTVLHVFDSVANGYTPMRGLVWDNGTIYGTTAKGGQSVPLPNGSMSGGSGTVWAFTVHDAPVSLKSKAFSPLAGILMMTALAILAGVELLRRGRRPRRRAEPA